MARYRRDSYWCKDYKEKIGDDPTKHFTDEKLQELFLSRSLAAITGDDCEFGPWMCCEAYYLHGDKWEPNDNTPLVWTQIDLKMALHEMEKSLSAKASPKPASVPKGPMKRPASAMS